MTATLGFVGLGVMGGRMAKRLLDAGYAVVGYNRTREKARRLAQAGLRVAGSPREVAEAAEAVFVMVTDGAALDAVARGPEGILAGLRRGALVIEMSTVSPAAVRALGAEVAARGGALLDAPVSGSSVTIEAGQLSFMVGGEAAALERARPWLLAIGPTITHVGEIGLAKTMKIAINQGLAVQMLAFSESVLLAEKAGIPRERAVEAVLRSVVASPMVKYRG
ncbi:MAG: NAD(P)-dependent oxidoreductase, partial [Candidatus Rokubacteria bacterium]|nr:NAD(P)-dependent oxidoreductase [Candidatus Rokubacteria bacterium]